MKNKRSPLVTAVALWELAVAGGIVLFWVSFFTTDLVGIADPKFKEIYLAFETAFPAADFALAFVLVLAASGLLKHRPWGRIFTLMGGGMLVFLGLLDTTFNLLQGIYRLGPTEAALNGALNLICLGSGIFLSFWAGRSFEVRPNLRKRSEGVPAPDSPQVEVFRYSWLRNRP